MNPSASNTLQGRALPIAAMSWWSVAVIGQLMFGAYMTMLYWLARVLFTRWHRA